MSFIAAFTDNKPLLWGILGAILGLIALGIVWVVVQKALEKKRGDADGEDEEQEAHDTDEKDADAKTADGAPTDGAPTASNEKAANGSAKESGDDNGKGETDVSEALRVLPSDVPPKQKK